MKRFLVLILMGTFLLGSYAFGGYCRELLSQERRDGGEVDDFEALGEATVTTSPVFPNGIRLAGWALEGDPEDYGFALAKAVYYFEIPKIAETIKIRLHYRGEGGEGEFEELQNICGRVWVRNYARERFRKEDDPPAGETYVLLADRYEEIITFPAKGHLDKQGYLWVEVIVTDGQLLDLDWIEVSSYRDHYYREVRVVKRYVTDWRPWYKATYIYYYYGPIYYPVEEDYYYCYIYSRYDRRYIEIRTRYTTYIERYWRSYYPTCYVSYEYYYTYYVDPPRIRRRVITVSWDCYDSLRREYIVVRSDPDPPAQRVVLVRNRVRQTISRYRYQSPRESRIRRYRPQDTRKLVRERIERTLPQTRTETPRYSRAKVSRYAQKTYSQRERSVRERLRERIKTKARVSSGYHPIYPKTEIRSYPAQPQKRVYFSRSSRENRTFSSPRRNIVSRIRQIFSQRRASSRSSSPVSSPRISSPRVSRSFSSPQISSPRRRITSSSRSSRIETSRKEDDDDEEKTRRESLRSRLRRRR